MRATRRSSYRLDQKKLNSQLKKRLLIMQNIWLLIVLSRVLSILILILTHYHERF